MPGTAKEDMAMKNMKFIALIVAAALLVCGAVGIISSAEEKHMEIDSANVAYNDMMHLAFTLKNTDTIPEGAEAGVAIWNSEKSDYTAKNASFVTFNANVDEETVYYKSEGVAAPEIGNVIFVAACYKLTWKDQKIFRGELKDLADIVKGNNLTLTTMIVVGDAIGNREGLSRLYASEFKHIFRQ